MANIKKIREHNNGKTGFISYTVLYETNRQKGYLIGADGDPKKGTLPKPVKDFLNKATATKQDETTVIYQ